jgi:hypothetical protein
MQPADLVGQLGEPSLELADVFVAVHGNLPVGEAKKLAGRVGGRVSARRRG